MENANVIPEIHLEELPKTDCAVVDFLSYTLDSGWSVTDNLTAILGFIGVAVTLLWTTYSSNKSRKREIAHELSSIKAALLAEVTIIIKTIERQIKEKHPRKDYNAFVPKWKSSQIVFESVVSKIGLLSPNLSEELVTAYLRLEQFDNMIGELVATKNSGNSPHHHELTCDAMKRYQQMIPDVLESFKSVQNNLKI